MPLPKDWATPEDFATLFQYMWHRDFPLSQRSTGATRADWTIHIGIVVRSIADLMGLVTRFEAGSRKDAVLRSYDGDEIAVEWEWEGVWGDNNEVEKLRNHKVWSAARDKELLKYAVLITYTHTPNIEKVCNHVANQWTEATGAKWPLLLILIDLEETTRKRIRSGKDFQHINTFLFDRQGTKKCLGKVPAFPWKIERSRWVAQTV